MKPPSLFKNWIPGCSRIQVFVILDAVLKSRCTKNGSTPKSKLPDLVHTQDYSKEFIMYHFHNMSDHYFDYYRVKL